jgi:hypothetical protein
MPHRDLEAVLTTRYAFSLQRIGRGVDAAAKGVRAAVERTELDRRGPVAASVALFETIEKAPSFRRRRGPAVELVDPLTTLAWQRLWVKLDQDRRFWADNLRPLLQEALEDESYRCDR